MTTTEISGSVSAFSEEIVPGTIDDGCFDYFDNKDIFNVIGSPSSDMTNQVRTCIRESLRM